MRVVGLRRQKHTGYSLATMDKDDEANRRRIVLHPRTAAARRVDRRRSYGSHVRGFTVKDEDVFELVAYQQKRALRYLALILVPVLFLLLSFFFAPSVTNTSVRGIPLQWLLAGPVTLFSIVLIAWRHDQNALRKERSWAAEHQDSSK